MRYLTQTLILASALSLTACGKKSSGSYSTVDAATDATVEAPTAVDADDLWEQRADPNKALAPDPEAANNKQDLQSAERLYEFAQRHSVPMVILSRHLQRECSLPRQLFDALGETGEQPPL